MQGGHRAADGGGPVRAAERAGQVPRGQPGAADAAQHGAQRRGIGAGPLRRPSGAAGDADHPKRRLRRGPPVADDAAAGPAVVGEDDAAAGAGGEAGHGAPAGRRGHLQRVPPRRVRAAEDGGVHQPDGRARRRDDGEGDARLLRPVPGRRHQVRPHDRARQEGEGGRHPPGA